MSRRNRRNKNKLINQQISTKPEEKSDIVKTDNSSIPPTREKDILNVVLIGGFCLALLVSLSYIINNTNWLAPFMNKFNILV